MKQGIHPEYNNATISCACGAVLQTKTTTGDLKVEVCSECHPFYTGKQKLVDSSGRVDKFLAKMKKAQEKGEKDVKKIKKGEAEKAAKESTEKTELKAAKKVEKKEEKAEKKEEKPKKEKKEKK